MMLRGERERERERERKRDYATSGGVLWALDMNTTIHRGEGSQEKWTFNLGFLLCTLFFSSRFVCFRIKIGLINLG